MLSMSLEYSEMCKNRIDSCILSTYARMLLVAV